MDDFKKKSTPQPGKNLGEQPNGPEKDRREEAGPEEPLITGRDAVALAYDPTKGGLPTLTAKGRGEAAEELIRLALEHGIPIRYDPDLVQVLSRLDVGRDIPEDVYLVVAELLAFIYWVNQEYLGKRG